MKNDKNLIYLVDDDPTNLMIGRNSLIDRFNVITIPSGKKLLSMLEKSIPDLILLDVEMPEMNGYEAIQLIKGKPDLKNIPVIFLTAKTDLESELEGLSLGAVDYIIKPFSPPLLMKRIEVHLLVEEQKKELINFNENLMEMVAAKTNTVLALQNTILKIVAELVECRDNITGGHIERTQNYLRILSDEVRSLGIYAQEMQDWDMEVFLNSAQLHDVGKIGIRDNLLRKPGKLTPEEMEEMKKHASFGVEIIEKMSNTSAESAFLQHAKILAGSHHEKWNGTGYPYGLSGTDIPLQGRLMAIVDVYDALISERPYKKPFSHEESVRIIVANKGSHFDPLLVDAFLRTEHLFRAAARQKGDGRATEIRPPIMNR